MGKERRSWPQGSEALEAESQEASRTFAAKVDDSHRISVMRRYFQYNVRAATNAEGLTVYNPFLPSQM